MTSPEAALTPCGRERSDRAAACVFRFDAHVASHRDPAGAPALGCWPGLADVRTCRCKRVSNYACVVVPEWRSQSELGEHRLTSLRDIHVVPDWPE